MAISVVGTNVSGSVAGDTTITQSYTTTTGTNKVLIVLLPYVSPGSDDTVSSVAFGGTGGSAIAGASITTGDLRCACWIVKLGNPSGTTANMVATFSGEVYSYMVIIELDGVDQTSSTHDGTTAVSDTDPSSITVSNVLSTDLVIDALIGVAALAPATVGANQTQVLNTSGGAISELGVASYQAGSAGGVMTWDLADGNFWGAAAFAVSEASGGGGGTVLHLLASTGVGK